MTRLLPDDLSPAILLPLLALAAAGLLWLAWRLLRRRRRTVESVVADIAYDYLSDFVIPSADEGEIHLDHLLLTAQGLLVLDVKDVQGVVFGSDKMQEWTVMAKDRRFTFNNPQHALYDRIAAVKQIVRQVPVNGRLLFLDGAEFTKGVPDLVCSLDDLAFGFGDADSLGAAAKIEAFKPHWEQVKRQAREGETFPRRRRRVAARRS